MHLIEHITIPVLLLQLKVQYEKSYGCFIEKNMYLIQFQILCLIQIPLQGQSTEPTSNNVKIPLAIVLTIVD